MFSPGDLVDVYSPGNQHWSGGYRILAMYNSHGLIEKGQQIRRHPLCWIRWGRNPHLVLAHEVETTLNPGNVEASSSSKEIKQDHIIAAVQNFDCEAPNGDWACEVNLTTMPHAWVTQFPTNCGVCRSMESILFAVEEAEEVLNEEYAWVIGQQRILSPLKNHLPAMTIEMENEMLSLTNPSRIAPKYFLRIPQAVEAAVGRNFKPCNKGQIWNPCFEMHRLLTSGIQTT